MPIRKHSKRRGEWSGPAAQVLKSVYGCSSPATLFLNKARSLFEDIRPAGPPFDPRVYAKALDIRIEERLEMKVDGMLRKTPTTNFTISVKADSPRSRINFTIAHELAHTFFYDALARGSNFRGAASIDPEEERLCDMAAAELLMPAPVFFRDLELRREDGQVTPRTLCDLVDLYQASLTAVARRVSSLTRDVACALWKRSTYAVDLQWITPRHLQPLILAQTGSTSIEKALGIRGQIFAARDTFYQPGKGKLQRRTCSLQLNSGSVLSVLQSGRKGATKSELLRKHPAVLGCVGARRITEVGSGAVDGLVGGGDSGRESPHQLRLALD